MSRSSKVEAIVRFIFSFAAVMGSLAIAGDAAYGQINFANIGREVARQVSEFSNEIVRSLPPLEQQVFAQLGKLPLDSLYKLKISSNACSMGMVNCGVVQPEQIRSFVDVELDRRKAKQEEQQAIEDATARRNTLRISIGSLIVSCFSFALSACGAFRKDKNKNPNEPEPDHSTDNSATIPPKSTFERC